MADYLGSTVNGPRRLRELLAAGEPVLAPGVYDALGARLVEEAGFDAVYMTGFGTAASLLGRPDVGLVTMSEMVDNARRIARACALPVIADADTGYGNAINVVRTVHEFEQAGVAGDPHRGPGGAQEVRSHGGQAGRSPPTRCSRRSAPRPRRASHPTS